MIGPTDLCSVCDAPQGEPHSVICESGYLGGIWPRRYISREERDNRERECAPYYAEIQQVQRKSLERLRRRLVKIIG